jgi:hypothetical protein
LPKVPFLQAVWATQFSNLFKKPSLVDSTSIIKKTP